VSDSLRELDAAVHERVMGEHVHDWREHPYSHGDPDLLQCRKCLDAGYAPVPELPAYSSDLRAAFEVVERLRGEGWRVEMGSAGDGWWANFWRMRGDRGEAYEREAETLPLAIVTSALATREGQP
jgi:hypothetical protein